MNSQIVQQFCRRIRRASVFILVILLPLVTLCVAPASFESWLEIFGSWTGLCSDYIGLAICAITRCTQLSIHFDQLTQLIFQWYVCGASNFFTDYLNVAVSLWLARVRVSTKLLSQLLKLFILIYSHVIIWGRFDGWYEIADGSGRTLATLACGLLEVLL